MTGSADIPAVVLCGGRATRMGSLAERTPKSLLPVNGRPILWHILGRLYLAGLRRFVLPLGHLGEAIEEFVASGVLPVDCVVECIDTGVDTPISLRLDRVRRLLPPGGDFLLTNGDAVFDFDLEGMIGRHREAGAIATFATAPTRSRYGLLLMKGGRLAGFERDSRVAGYLVETGSGTATGLVYTGICLLRTEALTMVDLAGLRRFEAELFPRLIARGPVCCFTVNGLWYATDTPKDLANLNGGEAGLAAATRALGERIAAVFPRC